MRLSPDQILAELLQLPAHIRARLAESLIASLEDEPDVEAEWQAEIDRRAGELDAGAVATRPAREVFRAARERLRGG
jgi:putative addiction module component (TIGR02574 family)